MSRHYLLDGYNILNHMPSIKDLPLEEGRRALVRWIQQEKPAGSVNNTVTVVFDGPAFPVDGREGLALPENRRRGSAEYPNVIFSRGSADDAIKSMVEKDSQRPQCVVVSNDKDIVLYARALGAKILSVGEFIKNAKRMCPLRVGDEGKYISLSRQAVINKELSKIWLNEK